MEQVCSLSFKDGKVFFRNRFVRSEAFIKEQQAQKMLYRGAFSVGNPSGGLFFNPFDFTVKGIANTSVLYWGGKLLALYEVGPHYSACTLCTWVVCPCLHAFCQQPLLLCIHMHKTISPLCGTWVGNMHA